MSSIPPEIFKFVTCKAVGDLPNLSSKSPAIISKSNQNSVACANKYDLLVAALNVPRASLSSFTVKNFDEHQEATQHWGLINGLSFPLTLNQNCSSVLHVLFSWDDQLFVTIAQEINSIMMRYFLTDGLNELGSHDFGQICPTCIKSNPCGNVFAVCMNDGSVQIWNFESRKLSVTLNKQLNASCASWSPKGKQLLVGCLDGKFLQVTPTGDIKRVVQHSPENTRVLNIIWIATFHFVCAYDRDPDLGYFSVVLHKDPQQVPVYTEIQDVIMSSFDIDPNIELIAFMHFIPEWKLIICASSKSSEIGVIAHLKHSDTWDCLMLDENARAQLPVPKDSIKDPLCAGLAVSFCSQRFVGAVTTADGETKPGKQYPVLFALTHFGSVHAFSIAYDLPDNPLLNIQPLKFARLNLQQPGVINQSGSQSLKSQAMNQITSHRPVLIQNQHQPVSMAQQPELVNSVNQFTPNKISSQNTVSKGPSVQKVAQRQNKENDGHQPLQMQNLSGVSKVENKQPDAAQAIKEKQKLEEAAQNQELIKATKNIMDAFSSDLEKLKLEAASQKPIADKSYAPLQNNTQTNEKFKNELKIQLDSLIYDVQMLKNSHLHTFNIAKRAKVFQERHNDEKYESYLKSAPLPPELQKLADSIQSSEGFIQLRSNEVLSMIESLASRERKMKKGETEYYTMINAVLQNNYKTIMALGQKLDNLAAKYDRKCDMTTFDGCGDSLGLYSKRGEMSTLDINCSLKGLNLSVDDSTVGGIRPESNRSKETDPESISALRDYLSRRTQAPVTRVAVEPKNIKIEHVNLSGKGLEDVKSSTVWGKSVLNFDEQSSSSAKEQWDNSGQLQSSKGEDRVRMLEKLRESVYLSQQPPSDKDAPVVNVKDLNLVSSANATKTVPGSLSHYQQPNLNVKQAELNVQLQVKPNLGFSNVQSTQKPENKPVPVVPSNQSLLFPGHERGANASAFTKPVAGLGFALAKDQEPKFESQNFVNAESLNTSANVPASPKPKRDDTQQKFNSGPPNASASNLQPSSMQKQPASGASIFGVPMKSATGATVNEAAKEMPPNVVLSASANENTLHTFSKQNIANMGNIMKSASSPNLNPVGQGSMHQGQSQIKLGSFFGNVGKPQDCKDAPDSILKSMLEPISNKPLDTNTAQKNKSSIFGLPYASETPFTTASDLNTKPSSANESTKIPQSILGLPNENEGTETPQSILGLPASATANNAEQTNTSKLSLFSLPPQQKSNEGLSIFGKPNVQMGQSIFSGVNSTSNSSNILNLGRNSTSDSSNNSQLKANENTTETSTQSTHVADTTSSIFVNAASIFPSNDTKNTSLPASSSQGMALTSQSKLFGRQGAAPTSASDSFFSLPKTSSVPSFQTASILTSEPIKSNSSQSVLGIPAPSKSEVTTYAPALNPVLSHPATATNAAANDQPGQPVLPSSATSLVSTGAHNTTLTSSQQAPASAVSSQVSNIDRKTPAAANVPELNPYTPVSAPATTTGNPGSVSGQSTTVSTESGQASLFGTLATQNNQNGTLQTQASNSSSQITSPFGQTTLNAAASNKSLFSTPSSVPFGLQSVATTNQSSIFGQSTAQAADKPSDAGSLFGGSAFSGLGGGANAQQKSSNVFGSPFGGSSVALTSDASTAASPFAQNVFGAGTQQSQGSVFGSSGANNGSSVFGSQSARTNVFGSPAAAPVSGSPFGATSGGSVFGQTGGSPFGSGTVTTTGSVFGKSVASPAAGQSAFGTSTAFGGLQGTGAFGSKTVFGIGVSNPAFGGGAVFGAGRSNSVFGGAAAPSSGGLFGGTSTGSNVPTFGALASGMGSGAPAFGSAASSGNSGFGSSAFGSAMSGSAFGAANVPKSSFSSWR